MVDGKGWNPMSENKDARTIRLSQPAEEAAEEIRSFADLTSIEEAIRQALSHERFICSKMKDSWVFLLRKGTEVMEIDWNNAG